MNELSAILGDATRSFGPAYFRLNIAGGDPIYRERVYCYELYHQMRVHWPADTPYYLNGEVDKAAHPILMGLGAGLIKPDLLVHQPGYMGGNHAVIEVKHSDADAAGFKKDLESLSLFINKVNYQRAILLIYGDEANNEMGKRIDRIAAAVDNLASVELWLHQVPGHPAKHINTLKSTVKTSLASHRVSKHQ